jgi:biopolymer transport protein ExbD
MKIPYESTEPDVRVELIPLIDVIFCILTFFLLAAVTLTRQPAINVDLPKASTGAPQMRDMLLVSIDPVGQTYIDDQLVTQEQLYQRLLEYQQSNPQGLIVLYANKYASYENVVEVLDLLRAVGGDRVALATLPEGDEPNALPNPGTVPGLEEPLNPLDPFDPTQPFNSPGLTDPARPFGNSDLTSPFNPNASPVPGLELLPSPPIQGASPAKPGASPTP